MFNLCVPSSIKIESFSCHKLQPVSLTGGDVETETVSPTRGFVMVLMIVEIIVTKLTVPVQTRNSAATILNVFLTLGPVMVLMIVKMAVMKPLVKVNSLFN